MNRSTLALAATVLFAARPATAEQPSEEPWVQPSEQPSVVPTAGTNLAGPPSRAPAPMVGPTPNNRRPAPMSEGGIAAEQFALGTLGMLGIELVVGVAAGRTNDVPLAVLGGLGAPAVGSLLVCKIGQDSIAFGGGCPPVILGGYLGAIAFGIPLAYYGYAHPIAEGDGGGGDRLVTLAIGLALGIAVGTGVGATVGWHLGKHPRDRSTVARLRAPSAPVASSGAWPELRRGWAEPGPTGLRVAIPLLALQF